MVNNCANPQCAKPLHYLREGRIFVFETQNQAMHGAGEQPGHHLEHFWLCGVCAQQFRIEHGNETGVRLVPRHETNMPVQGETRDEPPMHAALAS